MTSTDSNEYKLSNNILFVWACIHAQPKQEINYLYSAGHSSLNDAFVQLHAETRHDDKPVIYTIE